MCEKFVTNSMIMAKVFFEKSLIFGRDSAIMIYESTG